MANGYADRVDHRRTWSTDLSLAEPVDLVVCDQADGVFGLECGALDTLPDARERLGTPDARVVPARLTPLVVPVRSPKLREKLDAIGRTTTGLDASAMTRRALSTIWYRDQDSVEPAGPVLEGPPIELGHRVTRPVRVEGPLDTEGCDALACAFRVELAPGVTFSNAPSGADVIDRGVPMVPLAAGARPTHVDVALHPRSGVVRWRITTADDRLDGSTLGGLLDPALLHRLDPSRRPRPTEKGALAAKLLGAADGSQAADDLRAVLPEQHRDLVDVLLSDGYLVRAPSPTGCTAPRSGSTGRWRCCAGSR